VGDAEGADMVDDPRQDAFATLSSFSREVDGIFSRLFGPGWSSNRHVVVVCLVFSGEGLTTREISSRSGMGRRGVSRLVTSLRSDGLVKLSRLTQDGRSMAVILTAAGIERGRLLSEALDECFSRYVARAEEVIAALGGRIDSGGTVETDPVAITRRLAAAGVELVDDIESTQVGAEVVGRQRTALMQLGARGPLRPSDLADAVGASRSGTSYVIDELCRRELAVRRRGADPGDGRVVVVELTPRGADAAREIAAAYQRQNEPVIAAFSDIARWDRRGAHSPEESRRQRGA